MIFYFIVASARVVFQRKRKMFHKRVIEKLHPKIIPQITGPRKLPPGKLSSKKIATRIISLKKVALGQRISDALIKINSP